MVRCSRWSLVLCCLICLLLMQSCSTAGCAYRDGGERNLNKSSSFIEISANRKVKPESDLSAAGSCYFPHEVDGLRLTSVTTSDDAYPMFAEFIGPQHTIKDTHILCYKGNELQLVFWIAEMWNEEGARNLLVRMNRSISESNYFDEHLSFYDKIVGNFYYARFTGERTPFTHNFFYRKSRSVYWVSMSGEKDVPLVRKFVSHF